MVLDGADAPAVGGSHDHRQRVAAEGAVAQPRHVLLDLVEGLHGEARELDLRHRPQSVDRHAHRGGHDAGLGQRGVDHPGLAVLVEQPLGDAKDAAVDADVLAENAHAVVLGQVLIEGQVECFHHVELRHGQS